MAMEPKTMSDVLKLTQDWHHEISKHLQNNAESTDSERNQMLLDYLSEHEEKLSKTLETFREKADLGALDTWLYEYTDRHKIIHQDPRDIPFKQMSSEEITGEIGQLHNELVDLYNHLHKRAESDAARDVLAQLLDIEENKSKIISFGAKRSQEL